MTTPGRVLALDPGNARIGIAVTDPLGITAQPAGFIECRGTSRDVAEVRRLVEEYDVARVVVGHPVLMSGERGERARRSEALASSLRTALDPTPVELWDERLTTAQAERVLIEGNVKRRRRRQAVDAVAAALILQSWLDARGSAGGQRSSST